MPVTRTKSKWVSGALRFTGYAPSMEPTVASADGAVDVNAGIVVITKGSAAALTLVDPTATDDDGKELTVISTTAYQHTLSNAAGSGFDGVGAGADVATCGGLKGDAIGLVAYQGKWYIKSLKNVTLG